MTSRAASASPSRARRALALVLALTLALFTLSPAHAGLGPVQAHDHGAAACNSSGDGCHGGGHAHHPEPGQPAPDLHDMADCCAGFCFGADLPSSLALGGLHPTRGQCLPGSEGAVPSAAAFGLFRPPRD